MSIEIKVPTLPESVADATVLQWHKAPGEPIYRDENLVDLETDKVVLEVPAPSDGILVSLAANTGDVVTDATVLAIFEEQSIQKNPTQDESNKDDPASNDQPRSDSIFGLAVQKLLDQHQLSANDISPSGENGRLLKEDVLSYVKRQTQQSNEPTVSSLKPEAELTTEPQIDASSNERIQTRAPISRIRQTIARRLVNAQQTTAMLTTFNEVDMSQIINLRTKYKEAFAKTHDAKLGFMAFFVKASVAALQRFERINAHIDGTDIITANYNDIGIAVSSPRGLVVPILRDVQNKSFAQIETQIREYGGQAQSGRLSLDDLTGGTFTITNGGIFGSLISTPILNPPQSAILGMHAIQERPIAHNGEVVIRPMMYLALSYDHRIVDGKEAVQFLVAIKNNVEDPTRLLLELD